MKDKEDGHRFFNRNWVNFLEKCSDFLCCLFCSFFLKAFVCLRHQRLSSQSLNSSQDVDLWRNGKQSKKITWAHPCYIRTAANMTPAGATVPGLGPMSLGGWTSKVERCVCMCMCVLGAVAGYTAHLSRLSFSHMLKANTAICWIGTMCLYVLSNIFILHIY